MRDLLALLTQIDEVDWPAWLSRLDHDQLTSLRHAYAIEFLRANLALAHRAWFRDQLGPYLAENELVRTLQQRRTDGRGVRFPALTEKTLWGDLADVFHLVHFFATLDAERFRTKDLEPLLDALARTHFDGVYLTGAGSDKLGFISPEFQQLMLEIWRVKYLQIEDSAM